MGQGSGGQIVSYAERAFDPLGVESFTLSDSLIFSWFVHFEVSSCVPEVRSPSGIPIRNLLLAEHTVGIATRDS